MFPFSVRVPSRPAPAVPRWAMTPVGGAALSAIVPIAAAIVWGLAMAVWTWTWTDLPGRCAWGLVLALAYAPLGLIGGHLLARWLDGNGGASAPGDLARRDWAACGGIAGLLAGQLVGMAWFTGAYPAPPAAAPASTHLAVAGSVLYGPALLAAVVGARVGYGWDMSLTLERLAREQAARARVAARRLAAALTPVHTGALTPVAVRSVRGGGAGGARP